VLEECQLALLYLMYALFGVGIGMFLTSIFGFPLYSCYTKGRKLVAVEFFFYFFFMVSFIGILGDAVLGTILFSDPSLILQHYYKNFTYSGPSADFSGQLQTASLGMLVVGWVSFMLFMQLVIAAALMRKTISNNREEEYIGQGVTSIEMGTR